MGAVVRRLARHPWALVYALAVAVRLGALAWLGTRLGADSHGYKAAAEALRGDPLTSADGFVSLPPLYPLFLAIMPNDAVAAVAQALLGALLAPIVGMAVARHFGRASALAAALLAALEPSFVFWGTYLLTDALALVPFAVALEQTSAVLAAPNARRAFLCGAVGATAALTRAALAPPSLVLAAWHAGRRGVLGVAFALGLALVLLIPVARNVAAGSEAFLYRDQGWFLLWAGTRWTEEGRGTAGIDLVVPPYVANLPREEQYSYFRSEYLDFVTSHPIEYGALMARKALWFWLPAYPEWSLRHQLGSSTYFSLLYVLAAIGAAVTLRSRLTPLLLTCLAVIQLVAMLTIVDYDARYRLPAELCLLPLAGAGLVAAWRWLTKSRGLPATR